MSFVCLLHFSNPDHHYSLWFPHRSTARSAPSPTPVVFTSPISTPSTSSNQDNSELRSTTRSFSVGFWRGCANEQPSGGEEAEHQEPRPRLPVQGRQLQTAKLPQNEEGGVPQHAVQEEDQWRLLICKKLIALCCYHAKLCQVWNLIFKESSFGFVKVAVPCVAIEEAGRFSQSAACPGNQLAGSSNQLVQPITAGVSPLHPLSCTTQAWP